MLVGGGYELLRGSETVSSDKLKAMVRVMEMLDYDIGLLAPEESSALTEAGLPFPVGWQAVDKVNYEIVKTKGGYSVAIVYFPILAKNEQQPSGKSVQAIGRIIEKMRTEADLVIGMSVWGFKAEHGYLKMDTEHPDILLGSGPGMGLTGKIEAQGKTAWIRPYSLGKAVNMLEVLKFPKAANNFIWTEGENMHAMVKGLTEKIAENQEVRSIFGTIDSK